MYKLKTNKQLVYNIRSRRDVQTKNTIFRIKRYVRVYETSVDRVLSLTVFTNFGIVCLTLSLWVVHMLLRACERPKKKQQIQRRWCPYYVLLFFWVVNASSGEKSCLQFSVPTGCGVSNVLKTATEYNISIKDLSYWIRPKLIEALKLFENLNFF